ncbi:MAG: hypothetical protein KJZ80_01225 [Hyphomicrobiaceae bacterium]|nr:hypothetical protein [Hyphomicrobiaceae bacterium]
MDEKRSDQTNGRPNRGESARELVAQSMYQLVRLTRLGFQAAASGIERLEETMARRQRERAAEHRPMGEAPPTARPADTNVPEATAAGEAGERPQQPGGQGPGQSRH